MKKGSEGKSKPETPTETWTVQYDKLGALALAAVKELKALFDGSQVELMNLKVLIDNQAAALKAANDNIAELRKEFEAYKAAHP